MITYLKLIWAYLKIGLFGFGGGYAMLALIEREVVGPGWITGQMFTDIVAISQMTPGPIGINNATYMGVCHYYRYGHVAVVSAGTVCQSFHTPSQRVGRHKGHILRIASCSDRLDSVGGIAADEPAEFS